MSRVIRALSIVRFLQRERRARFGELLEELAPISRATLAALLAELVDQGEIEHVGREYRPSRGVFSPGEIHFYELSSRVREQSQMILERAARDSDHACALFARVGPMTMKIVDEFNLPDGDWRFSPVGYEWPLVPFHGFAKVFLAHADTATVQSCYGRWKRQLRPELVPGSWEDFAKQLVRIRSTGYALEYQEESAEILRLVVPVWDRPGQSLRFAVGFVARNIYLLEVEECLQILLPAAEELAAVLADSAES